MKRRITPRIIIHNAVKHGTHKLSRDLGAPVRYLRLRNKRVAPFHRIPPPLNFPESKIAQALLKGHFQYGAQRIDVGEQGDPWSIPAPSEKFAYWLHGFSWMDDFTSLAAKSTPIRIRFLIDRWVSIYGKWNAYAWKNELIAERLFYWLSHWSPTLATDTFSDQAQLRRNNVLKQLKQLHRTYSQTKPGLDRLRACVTLAMAGAIMQDNQAVFYAFGLDQLEDELAVQILPDGGHISRRPDAILSALNYLTRLDLVLKARQIDPPRKLTRSLSRLQAALDFFTFPEGKLACFNGGGEGNLAMLKLLSQHASLPERPFSYCPQSHYQRIEQGESIILIDGGGPAAFPYDREAHLAPLAFELGTHSGRMIVNCGYSPQQPLKWRSAMRATDAHTTLTLDGKSAGDLLKGRLRTQILGAAIKRAADKVKITRQERDIGVWIDSHHDGYHSMSGLSHHRRIFMATSGDDIRGEDVLSIPLGSVPIRHDTLPFTIRFHLHPSVRATLAQDRQSALIIQPDNKGWRFRTDGGPLSIEPSVYLGEGHKPQRTEQIIISGQAVADSDGQTRSNRVRWSFLRLEANRT